MSLMPRPSDETSLVFVDGSWWSTLKCAAILLSAYPAYLTAMFIFDGRENYLGLLGGALFLYALGAAFLGSISLVKSFGRSGWRFDRQERTAESWKGILVPWFRKQYRCDDFRFVSLSGHAIKRGYTYQLLYRIQLSGDGQPSVQIGELPRQPEARSIANALVRFLQLPLLDATGESARLISPAEIDVSLRCKQQADGSAVERLPQTATVEPHGNPPDDFNVVQDATGALQISIPPPQLKDEIKFPFMLFLFGAGIGTVICVLTNLRPENPDKQSAWLMIPALGFIVAFIGSLATGFPFMLLDRTLLRLTHDTIEIKRGTLFPRSRSISATQVRSIDVNYGGIRILAGDEIIYLGPHLRRKQLDWLVETIMKFVGRRPADQA